MALSLSIVIPTYNRRESLRLCLEALSRQTVTGDWEVLVVDDGSDDGSAAMATQTAESFPVPLHVFVQPRGGPSAARNRGMAAASGDLVLFLDDDILAPPDLLERHLQAHRQHPEDSFAALGYVTWSPELHPTPFMRWLGEKVWFCYGRFAPGAVVDGGAFYTCNVSLKRALLNQVGGFDESLSGLAYEDSELGWRLQQAGMNLVYHPEAWAHHYRFVTFSAACQRERRIAAARPAFENTAAGKDLLSRRRARSFPRWRQRASAAAVCLLQPLRPLLDTHIPLPSSVYRELLRQQSRTHPPVPQPDRN